MFLTLNLAVCNRQSILIIILHWRVSTLKEELKDEIKSVKSELSEATKSLSDVWKEVQSRTEKKDLQDQCDSTTRENNKLNEVISTLKFV